MRHGDAPLTLRIGDLRVMSRGEMVLFLVENLFAVFFKAQE